jgi:DNA-directed RNA polymerase specialized sigma24 family protein
VVALIPQTVDEVADTYRPLIRSAIHRTSKRTGARLSPDEQEDVYQLVFLKLIERNFLPRCHAFLSANPGRKFSTSLYTFVQNLTSNYMRDRGRRMGRFVTEADFRVERAYEGGSWGLRPSTPLQTTCESHEDRILARQYLGEIAGFLMDEPEILATVNAALEAGGELMSLDVVYKGRKLTRATVRRYVKRLKARALEVAA